MIKLLIISMLFIAVTGYAQVTYFNNRYDIAGTGNWDGASSILETDSGYLISGELGSFGSDRSIALLFIDKQENELGKKSYGTSGLAYYGGSGSLTKTYDDGYALGGGVEISPGIVQGTLWKFNQNGDSVWVKKYGDSTQYFETFYQCKQTTDSGFILIGTTDAHSGGGENNIWLVKTDKDGNFEWDTTYGGAGVEYGFFIEVINDGFLLSGFTESFGNGESDAYIIKTDFNGNEIWSKTYGGIYTDCAPAITQTFDGGYILAGCKGIYKMASNSLRKINIIKIDTSGSIIWDKTYGPTRHGTALYSIYEMTDSSFVMAGQRGNKDSSISVDVQGVMFKISPNGDSLWYRDYEYNGCEKNSDYFRDMKPTTDGGFIVAGFFVPNTSFQCNDTGTQDMWVLKLDSCGCAYPGCDSVCQGLVGVEELQVNDSGLRIYPNPTGGEFIVEIHNKTAGKPYQITVYDILGRDIKRIVANNNKTHVDISEHPAGLYFIQLRNENTLYNARIVKQ